VSVHLPSGEARQHSLSSDPSDRSTYRIAVLDIADGRGGSRAMHELRVGAVAPIGVPLNTFPMDPGRELVLLLAGGIGITPILSMARGAARVGRPATLVHAGRGLGAMRSSMS